MRIVEDGVVVRPRPKLRAISSTSAVSEPFGAYLQRKALNWSALKMMAKSPAHYAHAVKHGIGDTQALKAGRALHTATLEPEFFSIRYATWDGGIRRGKDWDAFDASAAEDGKEVLKLEEVLELQVMAESVRSHPEASKFLSGGVAERSLLWTVETPELGDLKATKRAAKSRIDYLGPLGAVDLKSTRDASPEGFGRQAWTLGYLGQAAFYVDAIEAVTGDVVPYWIVAVEKSAPFVVQVYEVPPALLSIGRDHYRDLLVRLAQCEASGNWHGYVDGVAQLALPSWVERAIDEDMGDTGINFHAAED